MTVRAKVTTTVTRARARSRRRGAARAASRLAVAPLLLWLLLALPGARPALGQIWVEHSEPPRAHYHSPQDFAFQLTFGPYRPDVDSEFTSGRHPYLDYFHADSHLLIRGELEYQVFHKMGTAAIGLGGGYFKVTGSSPPADHSDTATADSSTLTIIPVSLSAVYRFDYYLERNGIPIVPHARLGLDWAYWQITDGNGEIATSGGGRGRGGTLGWHVAIGAALVLDMFDPVTAHDFDVEMGVNHTALVFEYGHYDLSGLGESNRLHVGDTTWTLGLLFEF
jgi:hypothetical protein